jgi:N-methylhydantoinase B
MSARLSPKPWPTPPARTAPVGVDPIVLQIVEGTLNSIEREIEYAIERTARSPMIREAHDYRVGLFDRYCRKLTGRSYSAMPNAVVRDYPPETMAPGDVFLMNDTYLTEGSIGHLPDMCSTVPVFHEGEVVAYIQAFGHHDDIGGRVPGSMPGTAVSVFEEGLMIPPVKLYSRGVRNDEAFKIVRRNTRVPEMLEADLDSEMQAIMMGARRMEELFQRFGAATVEACFQAILDKCRDIYANELLPKIPDGEYAWEDFVEHDGVTDPSLHRLALKIVKRGGRITLDFNGTAPQSSGPINWPADYADGAFLVKWIAPVLRNLADTPERAAEIYVNEGVCEVFDVIFPSKGTLITPVWPAATNARSFVLLRSLGLLAGCVALATNGRMPADQETIRYTGFYGNGPDGNPFLSREVLGGGSGGRHYADGNDAIHIVPDSRNQPAEFTENRFPVIVERLALRCDSGGAGKRRGGLGYEKHYRVLVDCHTIVTADRVRLGCYGVNGGKAGKPFCVTVDLYGKAKDLGGLVDGEPLAAGQVLRVVTTGGGGWGDPLERELELVQRDVVQGKVSLAAARDEYGVALVPGASDGEYEIDRAATDQLRAARRAARKQPLPMIDRGPGYERMVKGVSA